MRKIFLCFFAVPVFSGVLYAQTPGGSDSLGVPDSFFRHYTGTAGRHKMVLDMRYNASGIPSLGSSTYYFTDEGGLNFFLTKAPPQYSKSDVFNSQVFPENMPLSNISNAYSDQVQTSRLSFVFSHDSIKGTWLNGNGQEQLPLTLKEDNTGGVPFIFSQTTDSVVVVTKKQETVKALATYVGVQPSPRSNTKDVMFIDKALARFMGGSESHIKDSRYFSAICFQKFFDQFRAAAKENKRLTATSFSDVFTLFPVYADNGFLVLQQGGYQYDFDKDSYTDQNRYLCLDLESRKTLQLDDILVRNNDMLSKLLENAFRKKYQVEPGKKLNTMFLTDALPVTDNFILVGKGLIFSYSPAVIFREEQDISGLQEMRLFLSYDELAGMLKPEFKSRVGLQ